MKKNCVQCNIEFESEKKICDNCISFLKFIDLIKNQFEYGGKKYALSDTRESTDILFDKHGKNWLFGTIDKYTFRYKNLSRERDLLKIACYMYILWLKRGFHVRKLGINDPPLDTNIQQKIKNFHIFVEEARRNNQLHKKIKDSSNLLSKFYSTRFLLPRISEELQRYSKIDWKNILESSLLNIFDNAFIVWKEKFAEVTNHDTDTDNERKENNNEKSDKK